MIRKRWWQLAFCLIFFPVAAQGGMAGDMDNFFDSLGYTGNVTKPHAYEGQAGGFYTGGSLFLRAPNRDVQFAHVDPPAWNIGCGGINIFSGGFAFVNGKELIDLGKNIMSQAAPYFFSLALETYAPQIDNVMNRMRTIAQKFNANNLSTCEMAQDLVGGLWPKHTAAQRKICQDVGMQNDIFSNFVEARQGCGQNASTYAGQVANTPQGKKLITQNVNVVWQQLQKQPFLSSDKDLAAFFMSISGTVVFDAKGNATILPSLLTQSQTISVLLNGGKAKLYHCNDTDKCLNIDREDVSIAQNDALVPKVAQMLASLQNKYETDTAASVTDKSFLQKTSYPALKLIEAALLAHQSIDSTDLATLIAQDIVVQYLNDILQTVTQSMTGTPHYDSLAKITASISHAQAIVNQLKTGINNRLAAKQMEINASLRTAQMVEGQLSSQLRRASGL